jgi:hypothetical protein
MQGLKLQLLSWLVPPDRLNIVQALVPSCDGGHKRTLWVVGKTGWHSVLPQFETLVRENNEGIALVWPRSG